MEEFEDLLQSRHTPKAPSNLAHRIVEAAHTQKPSSPRRQGVLSVLSGLFQPQPAFVLAVFVLLCVGAVSFQFTPNFTQSSDDVSLAFYVDDILGAEDYL